MSSANQSNRPWLSAEPTLTLLFSIIAVLCGTSVPPLAYNRKIDQFASNLNRFIRIRALRNRPPSRTLICDVAGDTQTDYRVHET